MVATKDSQSSAVIAPADRLAGKVALISSGTRGIGLAVAKAYIREGAKVVIASPTTDDLMASLAMLKGMGGDATGTRVDLDSAAACESLYNGALRAYGKIDILVNSASVTGPAAPILNYQTKDWAEVLRLNLDVVFWLTKAVLGTMIPGNGGSIINITSALAKKGRANWGAYSVAKAGVENLTEVLSEEVAEYNIRINCVDPGATRDESNPNAPRVEDVLNPFIYLASDASRGVTGLHLESGDWMGREF